MGLRALMRGKRVYFDANVFVYLMEGFGGLEEKLLEIRDCIGKAEAEIVTSELTLCEVLVVPFKENNVDLVAEYRQFIEESGAFEVQPTTRETYVRASLYRAQLGLKTPDAIHMATAIETDCEMFVTNDKTLKAPHGVRMVRLSEI